MAVGIDMFGAGGEGLGGLFVGNQMAMQRDQAEMERQKALMDMANTQQITEQRRLGNEYEGAILGDKIQQFKDAATQKKEEAQLERFNRQGEQFGRLGQMLSGVPGPARQAALRQMAGQAGIAEDNPLLQQFMTADPEALPDIMNKFSQGFYEQGDKAKAELLKREEMRKLAEQQARAKAEEGELNRQMRRDIAGETNQLRRDLAAQASADRRAAIGQRADAAAAKGGKGGPVDVMSMVASGKLTPQKAITYYEMKEAAEGGLSEGEQQAKENLQRLVLTMPGISKPDTSQFTGLPSQQQRVEAAIKGNKAAAPAAPQTKAEAAKAAPGDIAGAAKAMGIPYEPDKYEYRIVDGRLKRNPKSQAVPK